jgi:hypothetical protein
MSCTNQFEVSSVKILRKLFLKNINERMVILSLNLQVKVGVFLLRTYIGTFFSLGFAFHLLY